jgi:hypothetical protein
MRFIYTGDWVPNLGNSTLSCLIGCSYLPFDINCLCYDHVTGKLGLRSLAVDFQLLPGLSFDLRLYSSHGTQF